MSNVINHFQFSLYYFKYSSINQDKNISKIIPYLTICNVHIYNFFTSPVYFFQYLFPWFTLCVYLLHYMTPIIPLLNIFIYYMLLSTDLCIILDKLEEAQSISGITRQFYVIISH